MTATCGQKAEYRKIMDSKLKFHNHHFITHIYLLMNLRFADKNALHSNDSL
jgi:hypothetical protein